MSSWKTEVSTKHNGQSGWAGNGLRFATQDEALVYVNDLAFRWTSVDDTRAIESDDPVTHRFNFETRKAERLP